MEMVITYYLRGKINGPCLILPGQTGTIYSNQTGGCRCNHPKLEGTLVSLTPAPGTTTFDPNRWYLTDMCLFSEETIWEIEAALNNHYKSDLVSGIRVIQDKQNEEAWVWVECDLKSEGRKRAILTWENSD